MIFSKYTIYCSKAFFSKQEYFLHEQNLPLKVPKIQSNEIQTENDIGEQKDYTSCEQHKHHFANGYTYSATRQQLELAKTSMLHKHTELQRL